MKTIAILSCCLWCEFTIGQTTFHTPPTWTIDLMKEQHQFALPSPLVNYRDATNFSNGVNHKVYERFGHWLPMAKMVHDVQREAEFLRSLPEVDGDRLQY